MSIEFVLDAIDTMVARAHPAVAASIVTCGGALSPPVASRQLALRSWSVCSEVCAGASYDPRELLAAMETDHISIKAGAEVQANATAATLQRCKAPAAWPVPKRLAARLAALGIAAGAVTHAVVAPATPTDAAAGGGPAGTADDDDDDDDEPPARRRRCNRAA